MATASDSGHDWRGERGGRLVLAVIVAIFVPGVIAGVITGNALVAAIAAAGAGSVALLLLVLYAAGRGLRVGVRDVRNQPPH